MEWNIMWHQAITGPILKGIFVKKEQTVGFRIPVTQEGTKLRLHLVNQYGKKAYKIGGLCTIYESRRYSITVQGQRAFEIPVGASLYTDELTLPLKGETELELRVYYKSRFEDANNIEERAVLYKGDATQHIEAHALPRKDFETTYGLFKMVPVIDSVQILTDESQKTIVAFGDSITAMNRWVLTLK